MQKRKFPVRLPSGKIATLYEPLKMFPAWKEIMGDHSPYKDTGFRLSEIFWETLRASYQQGQKDGIEKMKQKLRPIRGKTFLRDDYEELVKEIEDDLREIEWEGPHRSPGRPRL